MDSIDDLLAEVKAKYDEPADGQRKLKPTQTQLFKQPQPSSIDSLLEQVKADYEQQDEAENLKIKQELQVEEHRQQQLQQQKLAVLNQRAIAWLKNLDPLSSEGIWFENFSQKYSSKLAAAIDYLQLEETND